MNDRQITISSLIQDVTDCFFWNKSQYFFDYLERRDFYKCDEAPRRKSYVNCDSKLDISIYFNSDNNEENIGLSQIDNWSVILTALH